MLYLKKSTAATIVVGPFVDRADAYTPENGIGTGTADELGIYKHGATALTDIKATTTYQQIKLITKQKQ